MCMGKYRVRNGSLCTPHFQMGRLLLTSGALGFPFPSDTSAPGPEPASTGVSDKAPAENPAGGSGSRVVWVGPDLTSCELSSPLLSSLWKKKPAQRSRPGSFLTRSKLPKEMGSWRYYHQTFQFLLIARFKSSLNADSKSPTVSAAS